MEREATLRRFVKMFMLDTSCYTGNASNENTELRFMCELALSSSSGAENVEVFPTGSTAEFYIDPILSCIDDIDLMQCYNDSIAIEGGRTRPSELPAHFFQTVRVYEMDASNLPGYVYVRRSYNMQRKNGRYSVVNDQQFGIIPVYLPGMAATPNYDISTTLIEDIFSNALSCPSVRRANHETAPPIIATSARHGPAFCQQAVIGETGKSCLSDVPNYLTPLLSFDIVPCIHCVLWPLQSADWPTRHRMHGWPDSPTIQMIISNSCDVVQVVHPLCRDDEWMHQRQWRLSFSRAEVTLLNSWTPLQQIIYHMLRFVIKKEVISKHNEKFPDLPNISGYHIKTLMLWACEDKPQSWWSVESSVVKLCSTLIHQLGEWVSDIHCPHYFIGNCNLLKHFKDKSACRLICEDLITFREEPNLLRWFINNYILPCVQTCPSEVKVLFDNITRNDQMYKAIDRVADWRRSQIMDRLLHVEANLLFALQFMRVSVRTELKTMLPIAERFSQHQKNFFHDVASLHIAYRASVHSFTEELHEMLCQLFEVCTSDISNSAIVIAESGITGAMIKAIHLAKTSTDCRNTTDKIRHEMSKTFLHISLKSEPASNNRFVHILLGFLYFKTGHYHIAAGHCKQVLNDCNGASCTTPRIEAEYLTGTNRNVDSMLGLIILYQHLYKNAFEPGQQPSLGSQLAFTSELLAHYLNTRCSALAGYKESLYQQRMYYQCLIQCRRLLVGDILLNKMVERQLVGDEHTSAFAAEPAADDREDVASEMNTRKLIFLLEQVALEQLIEYREKTFMGITPSPLSITAEFEEMYLYKCGLFEDCLQLCRNNISKYLQDTAKTRLIWTCFPELLCLFEGDLVSLYGLVQLVYPRMSLWLRCLSYPLQMFIFNETQSLCLMIECQKSSIAYMIQLMIRFA